MRQKEIFIGFPAISHFTPQFENIIEVKKRGERECYIFIMLSGQKNGKKTRNVNNTLKLINKSDEKCTILSKKEYFLRGLH